MAKDTEVTAAAPANVADDIKAKALGALNKSARESLDAKVKAHFQKRLEHERSIKQIDALIEADINAFIAGV